MSNFGTMVDRITNEMQRPDLDAEIKDAINSAIAYYDRENFWFLFSEVPVTLPANVESVTSPVWSVDEIMIDQPSGPYKMCRISWSTYKDYTSGTTSAGIPESFAVYNDQIYIYPEPQSNTYTLSVSGKVKTAALPLVGDADTNVWMTDAEALIRFRAMSYLYDAVLLEHERAAAFTRREADEYRQLKRESIRRMATWEIRGSDECDC